MSTFAFARRHLGRLLGRSRRQGITAEHVTWGYRLFLDREPENRDVVEGKVAVHGSTASLRMDFMDSFEFRAANPQLGYITESRIVIAELDDESRLFVDISDHVIGLDIARGHYEQAELAFVRRTVRPGDVVLDLGANIGFFSIHAARLVGSGGHVYAYEPLGRNADLLQRSVQENGFADRVTLRRAAVGGEPGTLDLLVATHYFNSAGSYVDTGGAAVPAGYERRRVPVVALGQEELRRPVRFVKIDVEGAEALALGGAEAILRADRPVILSEINTRQLRIVSGCTPSEFVRRVEGYGYVAHALGPDGEIVDDDGDTDREGVRSVVFLPP